MKKILEEIKKDDLIFENMEGDFLKPDYNPETHYLELTRSKYFQALLVLRHHFKMISDYYFGNELGAKNIDLFMLTPSISSPIGPGSDSEPIPIKFGKYNSNLVVSSQFGFEPILMNNFDKVYCYLPSMRGENPDKRHLNQFFHCEAEIKGELKVLIPIIETYIKRLVEGFLNMENILKKISLDFEMSKKSLEENLKIFKNYFGDENLVFNEFWSFLKK